MVSLSSTILKSSGEGKSHHQAELRHLCMRERCFKVRIGMNYWAVANSSAK